MPAYFSLVQPTFVLDPVANDPEINMLENPFAINVRTNEVSLDGQTIQVLVVLRSTRYSIDAYTEQFLMDIQMILSCDPLFPDKSLETMISVLT